MLRFIDSNLAKYFNYFIFHKAVLIVCTIHKSHAILVEVYYFLVDN